MKETAGVISQEELGPLCEAFAVSQQEFIAPLAVTEFASVSNQPIPAIQDELRKIRILAELKPTYIRGPKLLLMLAAGIGLVMILFAVVMMVTKSRLPADAETLGGSRLSEERPLVPGEK